jgi:hypothetical protein
MTSILTYFENKISFLKVTFWTFWTQKYEMRNTKAENKKKHI